MNYRDPANRQATPVAASEGSLPCSNRLLIPVAERVDRWVRWDRLWWPLGMLILIGLRDRLRQRNLPGPYPPTGQPGDDDSDGERSLPLGRTADGSATNPLSPRLGASGTPFGRNMGIAPEANLAESTPDAVTVSSDLLQRHGGKLKPAKTLNLLAAAWLQFEVHDWFAHRVQAAAVPPLGLPPLTPDPSRPGDLPVFLSDQTHWWDASQLYGANETFASEVRCQDSWRTGKVKVDDELLDVMASFLTRTAAAAADDEPAGPASTNPVPNLWTGLALFHVAFAHEHNAICDRLRRAYPAWTGEQLYQRARLINVAVMAKIHTVEWTPALLAHPTTERAIRATWWGLLGERVRRRFGRFGKAELLSGIPGSRLDDEVPYSITEDFVAVYRMHQLIPDEVAFRNADDGAPVAGIPDGATLKFEELTATAGEPDRAKRRLNQIGYANAWYSLGIANPGELTLHNNPDFRPLLASADDGRLDLGAADIMRTRECGVPRYNEFRRQLGMKPADKFFEVGRPRRGQGTRDRGGLRGRRSRRPHRRTARGLQAEGVRDQRHGISRVLADGRPQAAQRPVLHGRLHAGGLHEDRPGLDRRRDDDRHLDPALSRARARPACRRQSLQAVAGGDLEALRSYAAGVVTSAWRRSAVWSQIGNP